MAKRPFYTHPDPERPEYSNSFDLLFRGLELVAGGQRLDRYADYQAVLDTQAQKALAGYLDGFRYCMPPHGGFAIGLERFTAQLVGPPTSGRSPSSHGTSNASLPEGAGLLAPGTVASGVNRRGAVLRGPRFGCGTDGSHISRPLSPRASGPTPGHWRLRRVQPVEALHQNASLFASLNSARLCPGKMRHRGILRSRWPQIYVVMQGRSGTHIILPEAGIL